MLHNCLLSYRISLVLFVVSALLIITFDGNTAEKNGKISGIITDADTGEKIWGVDAVIYQDTVMMKLGSTSDLDGLFLILNVPEGRYNIRMFSAYYDNIILDSIFVYDSNKTEVNAKLKKTDPSKIKTVTTCGGSLPLIKKD